MACSCNGNNGENESGCGGGCSCGCSKPRGGKIWLAVAAIVVAAVVAISAFDGKKGAAAKAAANSGEAVSVLILCTGNSCRSQMAHGFMESFDPSLDVHSGGVNPAKEVNPSAVKAMKEVGIDISGHKPMGMENYVDKSWDYVITVCDNAEKTCPAFKGKVGRRIHMPFDDPSHAKGSAEFVWGEFERVRGEIRDAFRKLYDGEIKALQAERSAAK